MYARTCLAHIDKRCPCGASYGRFRHGNPPHPYKPTICSLFVSRHCQRRVTATFARTGHSYLIMSSHSQTTSGPSSDGISLPPDPTPIFELNQARRAKVAAELESLRSGKCRNQIFAKSTHRRTRSSPSNAFSNSIP